MGATSQVILGVGTAACVRGLVSAQRRRGFALARARPIRALVARACSALGFLVALPPPPAAAGSPTSPPGRFRPAPAPTWSETSGFPPPRPLVRASTEGVTHPELHGVPSPRPPDSGGASRLFPSNSNGDRPRSSEDSRSKEARRASEARGLFLYPSTRSTTGRPYEREEPERADARPECPLRRHTVEPGESLWAIASRALATDDPVRIDRYWRRIYRTSEHVVGPNPNLIHPGQRLRLPPECGR
jgi:hypothetical protein